MNKPIETKKLALIGSIFYAAAFVIQCLIAVSVPFIPRLVPGVENGLNPQIIILLLVICLLHIPVAVLAFWFSRQKEIKPFHLQVTSIAAPICYFGGGLLSFGLNRLAFHILQLSDYAALNTTEVYMNFVNFGYVVGFILLCCAVATEYYLFQHTPSDGEKEETHA